MRPFDTYFWGLLFIVVGIAFIIRHTMHINIPIMRIAFGFVLVYWGLSLIVGGFSVGGKSNVIFGNTDIKSSNVQKEYNTIFSNSTIDLRDVKFDDYKTIEYNTVFGSSTMKISADTPIVIKASVAFSGIHFPDGTNLSFGEYVYKTKAYKENEPYITIKADVAFGKLDIIEN
ncbi:MAG: LiaF-related protein [Clostridiales bacterium]|nr:LiaF-related protein [Clostridiales bacterium]